MSNVISKEKVWLIVSKDKKLVAKGTPRNRELVEVGNKSDKKRYLTYSSKGMAESGFKNNGFFGQQNIEGYEWGMEVSDFLEAVECEMTLKTI